MSAATDAELDDKLLQMLQVLVSKLPAGKTISTTVVQQLMRSKYGAMYSQDFVDSRSSYITEKLKSLMEAGSAARPSSTENASGSDESSDDEEDDEEESEEDEDEDEEGSSEEDEENDDEDDESGEENSDAEVGGEESPDLKRARKEESSTLEAAFTGETNAIGARCKAMVECLRKLKHRIRPPTSEESLEAYLNDYLIPEFRRHGMDPDKYSKDDLRRYKVAQEVRLLQQDGASLNLDRRSRVGRGYANVPVNGSAPAPGDSVPPTSAYSTSKFLDDE